MAAMQGAMGGQNARWKLQDILEVSGTSVKLVQKEQVVEELDAEDEEWEDEEWEDEEWEDEEQGDVG